MGLTLLFWRGGDPAPPPAATVTNTLLRLEYFNGTAPLVRLAALLAMTLAIARSSNRRWRPRRRAPELAQHATT